LAILPDGQLPLCEEFDTRIETHAAQLFGLYADVRRMLRYGFLEFLFAHRLIVVEVISNDGEEISVFRLAGAESLDQPIDPFLCDAGLECDLDLPGLRVLELILRNDE